MKANSSITEDIALFLEPSEAARFLKNRCNVLFVGRLPRTARSRYWKAADGI
jgi:hypothetical protein